MFLFSVCSGPAGEHVWSLSSTFQQMIKKECERPETQETCSFMLQIQSCSADRNSTLQPEDRKTTRTQLRDDRPTVYTSDPEPAISFSLTIQVMLNTVAEQRESCRETETRSASESRTTAASCGLIWFNFSCKVTSSSEKLHQYIVSKRAHIPAAWVCAVRWFCSVLLHHLHQTSDGCWCDLNSLMCFSSFQKHHRPSGRTFHSSNRAHMLRLVGQSEVMCQDADSLMVL